MIQRIIRIRNKGLICSKSGRAVLFYERKIVNYGGRGQESGDVSYRTGLMGSLHVQ